MSTAFAELSESLAACVDRIAPSTLALRGRGRRGIATATVWGEGGIAVTAAHALRHGGGAVTLVGDGGRSVDAAIVGTDASTDVAVLRLTDASLPVVPLGDAESVRCGHLVLAVGRGGDGEPSASYGLVNRASGPWQTWLGGQVERLIRLDGGLYDGLSGAPSWLQPARPRRPAPAFEPLTPRETQVLQQMSFGLGNREIADALHISPHTAKFHVAQIIAKLQAGSRAHAVANALRAGLVAEAG